MTRFARLLLFALFLSRPTVVVAEDWKFISEGERSEKRDGQAGARPPFYVKRSVRRLSGAREATVEFVFFTSKDYRLEVIDQTGGASARYGKISEAFRENQCVAGVNGGFFDPEFRPIGLMISQGNRVGALSKQGWTTTGVLFSDERGIHLTRRDHFRESVGIHALLQTGPYLVEHARRISGLDDSKSRRRTFIATDWRGNWALGVTSALSLAELAEILASPKPVTGWKVNRAINLDGGSSSGLFFDQDTGYDIAVEPWKRVRNLLGIVRR